VIGEISGFLLDALMWRPALARSLTGMEQHVLMIESARYSVLSHLVEICFQHGHEVAYLPPAFFIELGAASTSGGTAVWCEIAVLSEIALIPPDS